MRPQPGACWSRRARSCWASASACRAYSTPSVVSRYRRRRGRAASDGSVSFPPGGDQLGVLEAPEHWVQGTAAKPGRQADLEAVAFGGRVLQQQSKYSKDVHRESRADPAKTLLRTALSSGCSQIRCGRPATAGDKHRQLGPRPPPCRSGRASPGCASRPAASGRPRCHRRPGRRGPRCGGRHAGAGP